MTPRRRVHGRAPPCPVLLMRFIERMARGRHDEQAERSERSRSSGRYPQGAMAAVEDRHAVQHTEYQAE